MTKTQKSLFFTWLLSLLFTVTSCGGDGFRVVPVTQNGGALGSFTVPKNADFIIAFDNTGSMDKALPALKPVVTQFVDRLEKMDVNYRLVAIPLVTFVQVDHVIGSIYDVNRGSARKPRYPGDSGQDGMLAPSVYQSPSEYSGFNQIAQLTNSNTGSELGLNNIVKMFQSGFQGMGFPRPDAMTFLIIFSNGDDTGLNFCGRDADGMNIPCEDVGKSECSPTEDDPTGGSKTCGSMKSSLNFYSSKLKAMNPDLRVYSIVSHTQNDDCLGTRAYAGKRYEAFAKLFQGESFDLCAYADNPFEVMSSAMGKIASYLEASQSDYVIDYAMVSPGQTPQKVTIHTGGDPNRSREVPQDLANGWTFVGDVSKVYTMHVVRSDGKVIYLNQASGSAIQFHGTAGVTGRDRVLIDQVPTGARDSRR